MVYRTGATRGVAGENVLTYVVEVTNRSNIRDMVFVDANAGKLLNRYSMMDDALDRHVFEQRFTPGCARSGPRATPSPAHLNEDQQNIVLGSGEAYWFFRTRSAATPTTAPGSPMNTVNNDPTIACPNANWNGTTTNYCNGVTSDDTVAHEWAHAYTEHTSDLIYQWQSGALNESYSDIWGETVDMVNGRQDQGDDTTTRPVGLCSTQTRGDVRLVINSPADIARTVQRGAGRVRTDHRPERRDRRRGRRPDAARPGRHRHRRLRRRSPTRTTSPASIVYVDRGVCTFQTKVGQRRGSGRVGASSSATTSPASRRSR